MALTPAQRESLILELKLHIENGAELHGDDPASPIGVNNLREVPGDIVEKIILGEEFFVHDKNNQKISLHIKIPITGLRLRWLFISRRIPDRSGIDGESQSHTRPHQKNYSLELANARDANGGALPPLSLKRCLIPWPIHMPRAHFRSLALEGCHLTDLIANGIHVDGFVDLGWVRPAEWHPSYTKHVQRDTHYFPGASHLPCPQFHESAWDGRYRAWDKMVPSTSLLPSQLSAIIERNQKASQGDEAASGPRCWIQLRNAHIGIDVLAEQSYFICPPIRPQFLNDPHAYYALDLRGAHVSGRVALSPSTYKAKGVQFVAIGGVSIVRAVIGASFFASGALLVAVEGNALAAERADIGGHLILDYQWVESETDPWLRKELDRFAPIQPIAQDQNRGSYSHLERQDFTSFRAEGFIDLTNCRIGSSVFMRGAHLLPDHFGRDGLEASGIEVRDACILSAAAFRLKKREEPVMRRFFSSGGVTMRRASIRGELQMDGAELMPNSWKNAFYAPGLSVQGEVRLSVFDPGALSASDLDISAVEETDPFGGHHHKDHVGPCEKDCKPHTPHLRCIIRGRIALDGAHFHRNFNMRGTKIIAKSNRTPLEPPDDDHLAIRAPRLRVDGTILFDTFDGRPEGPHFCSYGTVLLRNAEVGRSFLLTGACIRASYEPGVEQRTKHADRALDLTCARIGENLRLDSTHSQWAGASQRRLPFYTVGAVLLSGVRVNNQLLMYGAQLQCVPDVANTTIFDASRLHVSSAVSMTCKECPCAFEAHGDLSFDQAELLSGLEMNRAVIKRHVRDASRLSSGPPIKESGVVLSANKATISSIEIEDAAITGSIRFRELSAPYQISFKQTKVREGIVDLFGSALGNLYLKGLRMGGPIPTADVVLGESVDVLHLGSVKIGGVLEVDIEPIDNPLSGSHDAPDAPPTLRISLADGSSTDVCANLRGLHVGSLKDNDGKGWHPQFRLKLEGFESKRAPERRAHWEDTELAPPRRKWTVSQILITFLRNPLLLRKPFAIWHPEVRQPRLSSFRRPFQFAASELFWHYHSADAHIEWLNRQYRSWIDEKRRIPRPEEFTSSAYDQLSAALQRDGYDNESKRILSAKLDVKRKVDAPVLSRPFWWAYWLWFDYGLSATNSVITCILWCVVGYALVWVVRGHDKIHPGTPILVSSVGVPSSVFINTAMTESNTANQPDFSTVPNVSGPDIGHYPREVPCGNRIDPSLYAVETFVPGFEFAQTKRCEVSSAPGLFMMEMRLARLSYGLIGWVIVSITALTIPGFLRGRAKG